MRETERESRKGRKELIARSRETLLTSYVVARDWMRGGGGGDREVGRERGNTISVTNDNTFVRFLFPLLSDFYFFVLVDFYHRLGLSLE